MSTLTFNPRFSTSLCVEPHILEHEEFGGSFQLMNETANVSVLARERGVKRKLHELTVSLRFGIGRLALQSKIALLGELFDAKKRDPSRRAHVRRQHVGVELLQLLIGLPFSFDGRAGGVVITSGRIQRDGGAPAPAARRRRLFWTTDTARWQRARR